MISAVAPHSFYIAKTYDNAVWPPSSGQHAAEPKFGSAGRTESHWVPFAGNARINSTPVKAHNQASISSSNGMLNLLA